jgi:hypothetical protein
MGGSLCAGLKPAKDHLGELLMGDNMHAFAAAGGCCQAVNHSVQPSIVCDEQEKLQQGRCAAAKTQC